MCERVQERRMAEDSAEEGDKECEQPECKGQKEGKLQFLEL